MSPPSVVSTRVLATGYWRMTSGGRCPRCQTANRVRLALPDTSRPVIFSLHRNGEISLYCRLIQLAGAATHAPEGKTHRAQARGRAGVLEYHRVLSGRRRL